MAAGHAVVFGEDGDVEMLTAELNASYLEPASRDRSRQLLEDVNTDNGDGRDPGRVGRHSRRTHWWQSAFFLLFLLASLFSLLLLLKIAFFDSLSVPSSSSPPSADVDVVPTETESTAELVLPSSAAPTATSTAEAVADDANSFRRPDSDYVLGMDWDYNAPATVREYNWIIQNVEANPDGVFRLLTTVNGKFPGEMIRCNEGDTIVVNVENRAVNATALHWHGLFQNGTNHMDGTPGATQCAIAPGRSFRYEFAAVGQAGTYFYHGHQGADALDGLVGPLIIHARDEPAKQLLPYESDRVVMVQDWYHDPSGGLLMTALAKGSESSPMPNGALINGVNVVDCDQHPGRRCDNSTARLAALDLAAGASHRLRFIHVGGFAWFEINVDHHHSLPLTEIDGVDIEPASEKSILIAPGQRYSVVLTANATGGDSAFWMHARIATHCFSEYTLAGQDNPMTQAVVRYTAPSDDAIHAARLPTTDNDAGAFIVLCQDMHTRNYAPYPPRPAPAHADRSYYLRVNLEIGNWQLQRGFFNGSSYRPNLLSPALHRAVDGLRAGNESYGVAGINRLAFDEQSELVIGHTDVQVVDLVLQNFDEGTHPLHLHGHQLFVLGAGHGYFPGYEAFNMAPLGRGLLDPGNTSSIDNPLRRDVATVEGFGWTLVRFVADNPGVWRFHCHMIWHGDGGMAMLFLSRTDDMTGWEIPAANRALCDAPVDELESGSAPKDSIWFGHGN
ncbi:diphenol oxidase [Grosmannia clavigera kw1407]|uniref:Diphenol oxidase n=1 Tax=Grosmannia clavigera (strain kw1407 / UAMH 11150) TaxID=655863 RepID=F0X9A8_GROCL|nr:diphenol oxidase [Grosmannia clavigera kw1407]EFX05344.1 diphenol oxidase [Grosmannia clavigera kw1407]